ncbi:hypothetical protein QE152_g25549 [Popillia japonica]|uniref:Uncharacterized protein n=1 Tax=Popillia japonica TaxID=7064 RepID=A0AAW1K1M1_POPJA
MDVEDVLIINQVNNDAFELSDTQFIKNFRLTKELTRGLIESVSPFINPPSRISALTVETKVHSGLCILKALTVETKVFVTLHFYGHGTYQEDVAKHITAAISLKPVLADVYEMFYRKYNFPGIIRCIDVTHIAIVQPNEEENIYVNRKNYHSLNVQLRTPVQKGGSSVFLRLFVFNRYKVIQRRSIDWCKNEADPLTQFVEEYSVCKMSASYSSREQFDDSDKDLEEKFFALGPSVERFSVFNSGAEMSLLVQSDSESDDGPPKKTAKKPVVKKRIRDESKWNRNIAKKRKAEGVKETNIKDRPLREPNLTLQRAIEVCQVAEITMKQIESMQGKQEEKEINYVDYKKQQLKKKENTHPRQGSTTEWKSNLQKKDMDKNLSQKSKYINNCTKCSKSHYINKCPAYGQNKMETFCKPPKNLSLQGNVSENWRKFKQNFEIFLLASGNNKKPVQTNIALFLNMIGEDGVHLYNTFDLTTQEQTSLTDIIKLFDDHCSPKKNVVFETYKFFKRDQLDDEKFDTFLIDIKKLSQNCDFDN